MRFKHADIFKIVSEINIELARLKEPIRLYVDFSYESVAISGIEGDGDEKTLLLEYTSRDEAHRWLEGFITAKIN